MVQPKSEDTPDSAATWVPTPGARVVLFYPASFGKTFPRSRVGEVIAVLDDGSFTVLLQPSEWRIRVVPEEYARDGATFRGWLPKDGWPFQKPRKKKEKLAKHKRVR